MRRWTTNGLQWVLHGAPLEPSSKDWPKTVAEAVDRIVAGLDRRSIKRLRRTERVGMIKFHLGWGMGIRNDLGLWMGNDTLLKDSGTTVPDDCSLTIMEGVWDRVNA